MRLLKKLLFVFVSILTVTLSTNVYAMESEENVGVSPNPPADMVEIYDGSASIQGTSSPSTSNVWSWSDGAYHMSGNTSNTNLYTNYVFTGVSTLKAIFTKADEPITVELWERTAWYLSDAKRDTYTISRLTADDISAGRTRTATFPGLSSSSKYYLKILAPAHFIATVTY